MKNKYKEKFQKTERKLQELEELLNLYKWASRTGDEPDVWPPDRKSWRKKIKESQTQLKQLEK